MTWESTKFYFSFNKTFFVQCYYFPIIGILPFRGRHIMNQFNCHWFVHSISVCPVYSNLKSFLQVKNDWLSLVDSSDTLLLELSIVSSMKSISFPPFLPLILSMWYKDRWNHNADMGLTFTVESRPGSLGHVNRQTFCLLTDIHGGIKRWQNEQEVSDCPLGIDKLL